MKRILLVALLLSLWLNPLWSLPSPTAKSEWPLCLTESEWNMLEDQVWAETQKTVETAVLVAVEAAVAPYKVQAKKRECQILGLKISLGIAMAGAGAALLWAALK